MKNEWRRTNVMGSEAIFAERFCETREKEIKLVGVSIEGISLEFHDRSGRVALHNSWKSRGIDTSSRLAGKKRRTRSTEADNEGPDGMRAPGTSLSFQVRCARCRALAHSSDTIYVSSFGARTRHDEFICHTGIGRPQGLLMELGQVFGVCRG